MTNFHLITLDTVHINHLHASMLVRPIPLYVIIVTCEGGSQLIVALLVGLFLHPIIKLLKSKCRDV